ncbi:hypothetical protein [uncultured Erythrobacter sp.]|uniref:hypothetical protein n=1 Tax=uncultured Erythrobacter sp. TaxID=263913 RepID=UPI0026072B62|nr:hypothetical protein [uncultured Erythrobacter sp.]
MADEFRTNGDVEAALGQLAALREYLVEDARPALLKDPQLAEAINQRVSDLISLIDQSESEKEPPTDHGLMDLIGLSDDPPDHVDSARYVPPVPVYDDQVSRERLLAIADLYYLFQMEQASVFRAVLKLQELFRAGTVRLSDGEGAIKLFRFDRHSTLRYTMRDRYAAYRKVFSYTDAEPPKGARPNAPFHKLFTNFNLQVSQFFQDKRVSEVIRKDGSSESFGSMAVVRRAGLDLRYNLRHVSYGHIAVLRNEVMGLLESAFAILGSDDIMNLFGSPSPWDTLEEIQQRYLNEAPLASQRSRMAEAGRDVLRWLAEPYILSRVRIDFETYLEDIVDQCDDWLTSAESLGLQKTSGVNRPTNVIPLRARVRR